MEEFKPDLQEDTIFNLGLAQQEYIFKLFEYSTKMYFINEPISRSRALLAVKRCIDSELKKEEREEFDKFETEVENLLAVFEPMTRHGARYNVEAQRYLVLRGANKFYLTMRLLNNCLSKFEKALRNKLSPQLFPRGGDRRFALGGK